MKSAVWTVDHPLGPEARCFACHEIVGVARWTPLGWDYAVVQELIRLPDPHDGLVAFGLTKRTLTTGRDQRGAKLRTLHSSWRRLDEGVSLPIYVYCPRRGVCGRGQRLDALGDIR